MIFQSPIFNTIENDFFDLICVYIFNVTALQIAVYEGKIDIVQFLLLQNDIDVNARAIYCSILNNISRRNIFSFRFKTILFNLVLK